MRPSGYVTRYDDKDTCRFQCQCFLGEAIDNCQLRVATPWLRVSSSERRAFFFPTMCQYECFGDYYRGCQHYVKRYYSGEKKDCGSLECLNSESHKHHRSEICRCADNKIDEQRVANMFQFKCDPCLELARQRYR